MRNIKLQYVRETAAILRKETHIATSENVRLLPILL